MLGRRIGIGATALALAAAVAGGVAWTRAGADARARAVFLARSPVSSLWARVRAPAVMTLCDLRGREAQMNGRVVRVRTTFFTDGIERSGLSDDRCPNVRADLYDEAASGADLGSKIGSYGLGGGAFEIEFVGSFEHVPSARPTGRFHAFSVVAARPSPPNPEDERLAQAARAAFTLDLPEGAQVEVLAEGARDLKLVQFLVADYGAVFATQTCGSDWFAGDHGEEVEDGPGRRKLLVRDAHGRGRPAAWKIQSPHGGWPGCLEVAITDDEARRAEAERMAASVRFVAVATPDPHEASVRIDG